MLEEESVVRAEPAEPDKGGGSSPWESGKHEKPVEAPGPGAGGSYFPSSVRDT